MSGRRLSLVGSERALARRIKYERERRDISPSELARRMAALGCPMNQSGIWKIENGDPPRRITVDELVAFSRVFQVPADDLLLPAEVVRRHSVMAALEALSQARLAYERASEDLRTATERASRDLALLGLSLDEVLLGARGPESAQDATGDQGEGQGPEVGG